MITSLPITEAEILNEIVEPGHSRFNRQVAEKFLSLCFNESARERIRELLRKNNAGLISETEQTTLQNYLRVGEFLDLLQAKARVSLLPDDSAA